MIQIRELVSCLKDVLSVEYIKIFKRIIPRWTCIDPLWRTGHNFIYVMSSSTRRRLAHFSLGYNELEAELAGKTKGWMPGWSQRRCVGLDHFINSIFCNYLQKFEFGWSLVSFQPIRKGLFGKVALSLVHFCFGLQTVAKYFAPETRVIYTFRCSNTEILCGHDNKSKIVYYSSPCSFLLNLFYKLQLISRQRINCLASRGR